MRHNPQPQEMYRHFKGNIYQIRCLAKHSETDEILVIYQAMYGDFQIYARELSSFMEELSQERYPDAAQKYRFELIGDMESSRGYETTKKPENIMKSEEVSDMADDVETAAEADVSAGKYESQEELNIDPLVLQFLDADSYEKRLEILSMLHSRIDNDMINTMAVSVDIEIKEGDVEDRYEELKNCLLTLEKYECNRLR
ncbi:MAG: DUF1653 domain-containing protein [Lachnospiraceae bacterium]|nr:DUF1653 domain-containing protein [Lachnospiraceae bacterium]